MRRALFVLAAALVTGALLFWALDYSRGFILIAVGNHMVQISLWLAVLLLAVIWLGWRLLAMLVRPGVRTWRGRGQRRAARQQRELLAAVADYYEGRWQRARAALVRSAKGSAIPGLNYVLAADAAARTGEEQAAQELLQAAEREIPAESPALTLARAEIALRREDIAGAVAELRRGWAAHPRQPRILELLRDCLVRLEDWDGLAELLPALRRTGTGDLGALEARLHAGRLAAAAQAASGDGASGDGAEVAAELAARWAQVPRALKSHPDCLRAHARALIALGDGKRAERELRRYLERDWDPELVLDWEAATRGDPEPRGQLAVAERWLREREPCWQLLLVLGRLCQRLEIRGKSRDYLEQALRLTQRSEIYAELGATLSASGDQLGAVRCYRQAVGASPA